MRMTRSVAAGACAAACLGAPALVAAAAPGESVTVIADRLNNPRNLAMGADGSIYVAEAGKAGPTCLDKKQETCIAFSGSVSKITGRRSTRIVTGLLSAGGRDGSFTAGADGVALGSDGSVYVAMTAVPECGPTKGIPARATRQLGHLLVASGGTLSPVANVARLECTRNPDGQDRNSNPYAVLALGKGRQIVVDAGANALLDVRGGRVSVLALMPKNGKAQSVPTSITKGPDGALYVGDLGGERNGSARVWRVVPGQKPTVHAKGFTAITGIAFGPDRSMYVTELSTNMAKESPNGDVVRVKPDGSRTRLGVGKLFFPSGAVLDAKGRVYVSNYSVLPESTPKKSPFKGAGGQVVRITPGA
jgi:sugar lactone lactonase YvrE